MIATDLFDKIKLSIIYLQYNNLIKILVRLLTSEKIEIKNKFNSYLKTHDNGIGFINNNKFVLIEHLSSNATRQLNKTEYNNITMVINHMFF